MQHGSPHARPHGSPRARPTRLFPAFVPTLAACAALALTALIGPAALGAQGTIGAPDECYGFAFGRWDPPLDMRAAGHHVPSPDQLAHAPGGRDWAAAVAAGRDTTLLLFPAWWPAGVAIRFPAGVRTPTDTVRGRATALVADGRVRNPEAAVLAWPVSCGGTPPDRAAGRTIPAPADPSTDSSGRTLSGRDRPRPPARPRPARVPTGDGSGSRGR